MSAGVSQYTTIEHSSHHVHAVFAVHALQVQVAAVQLRVSVRVPHVVQFAVRV
jgi:hypothetical protein